MQRVKLGCKELNKIDKKGTFNNTLSYISLFGSQVESLTTCSCIPALGRWFPIALGENLPLPLLLTCWWSIPLWAITKGMILGSTCQA